MEVQSASRQPAAWYHANMSVFRSIPDAWAIGQLFPIVPLHRLSEPPAVSGSLADLTCDSDGRAGASSNQGVVQSYSFISHSDEGCLTPQLRYLRYARGLIRSDIGGTKLDTEGVIGGERGD